MKRLVHASFFLLCFLLAMAAVAQSGDRRSMRALIDDNLRFAAAQYKVLARNTPAHVMPRSFRDGKLITADTEWWTSGFYPGALWYIYEHTRDTAILAEAERRLVLQESIKRYTGNHDIGFMIFCSFGNAYRITGNPKYKEVIDTAAVYQITRFRPAVGAIQSWNKNDRLTCPVIIDNMMNLEQLCWVSQQGGSPQYRDIAVRHANTTLRDHYRPDFSSYHLVDYNPENGSILKKITWQGLADSSAWARGQAWGLYGFVVMYRFTKDPRYLEHARGIARFLVRHPNLPADKIPYWDFDVKDPKAPRDASAASITASALLELGQYVKGRDRKEFVRTAEGMLRSLSSDAYRAKPGENGGFLLMHGTGHLPANSEVDVPLTYGDYYFIEALLRYRRWYAKK